MRRSGKIKLCLAGLLACTVAFAAAACGEEHTHTYLEAWAFDAQSHWHPASCSHDVKQNKSEHSFEDIIVPPTENSEGYTLRLCACGYSVIADKKDPLPAGDAEYRYNEEGHWKPVLSAEGEPEVEEHDFEEETVLPTCTTAGYLKKTCTKCGYWRAENVTEPCGHTEDTGVWEHNETSHWHPCLVCGLPFERTVHHYTEKVTPHTCDEDGYTDFVCECGYSYRGDATSAAHTYSDTFSSDEYEHWRPAVCEDHGGDDGQETDRGEHLFIGRSTACAICGKEVEPRYNFKLDDTKQGYVLIGIGSMQPGAITIPAAYRDKPVTEIGKGAFDGEAVTSVSFDGNNLVKIGDSAFANTKITEIDLPEKVEALGKSVFANTKLSRIGFNAALQEIGDSAFANTEIADVELPANLLTIGAHAFENTAIPEISFPAKLQTIGDSAFVGTGLTTVSFPASVQTIGAHAFALKDITSVTLGSGVKTIGTGAFEGTAITEISFPDSVQSIGGKAFAGTGITSVSLGTSIEELGTGVFSDCASLQTVTVTGALLALPESAFENCAKLGTVTTATKLQAIGALAFSDCVLLTSVDTSACTEIGFGAFGGCALFKPTSLEHLATAGQYAFSETPIEEANLPALTAVAPNMFDGCTALSSVTTSAEEIGAAAFRGCTNLTTVTLTGTVAIGEDAFDGCTNLATLAIPDTIEHVGANAFNGTKAVSSKNNVRYVSKVAVGAESSATAIVLEADTLVIADGAFSGNTKITSVTLSAALRFIGMNAFRGCTKVTAIDFTAKVEGIGANAFRASGLTNVVVPATVKTVGESAFYDCKSLVSAEVNAENIGRFAFSYTGVNRDLNNPVKVRPSDAKLTSVTLGEGVKTIGSNAFQYCPITAISLPESLQSIGAYTFAQTDLTAVSIPAAVTSIGAYAFYNTKLSSATFAADGWTTAGGAAIALSTPSVNAGLLTQTYLDIAWVRG